MNRLVGLSLFALPLAGAAAAPAAAQQVIIGTVIEQGTDAPLADALVFIGEGSGPGADTTRADSARASGVVTDENGRFQIAVGDRSEVILTVSILGYQEAQAFFVLPTDGPVRIPVPRQPILLEGIEARVDRTIEVLEARVRSLGDFSHRMASMEELRDFDQTADLDWFLPSMNVAVGTGCEDCYMMAGRFQARFFVDDFEVSGGEFRSYQVGEICRIEVVRKTRSMQGGLHAYTCSFMEKVTNGRAQLAPLIPGWWPGGS